MSHSFTATPMGRVHAALLAGQIAPATAEGLKARWCPDYAALEPLVVPEDEKSRYDRTYWPVAHSDDDAAHDLMAVIIADVDPQTPAMMRQATQHSDFSKKEFDPETVLHSVYGDSDDANDVLQRNRFALLRYLGFIMPRGLPCAPVTARVEAVLASRGGGMKTFYQALMQHHLTLDFVSAPLAVQQMMHAANADVIMLDLKETAFDLAGSLSLGAVLDAAFILAHSDYAALPALPEVIQDMLEALEESVLMSSRDWYASARTARPRAGDVLDAAVLSRDIRNRAMTGRAQVTPRMFFAHVGVTIDEILAFAHSRPFYHEAQWFNHVNLFNAGADATAAADASRARNLMSSVSYVRAPSYVRDHTLANFTMGLATNDFPNMASYARLVMFDVLASAARYSPRDPALTSAHVVYAYTLDAVAEFVRRNIAPIVKKPPPLLTVGPGDSEDSVAMRNWLRCTATFDFLDALRFEATVHQRRLVLDTHDRKRLQISIGERIAKIALDNNRKGAAAQLFAQRPVVMGVNKDLPYQEAFNGVMKHAGLSADKIKAFEKIVHRVDGEGGDYANFDERRVDGEFWIIDPAVRWESADDLYLLCDPDFYLYYMLVRLLWKARWHKNANTPDDVAMRMMVATVAINGDDGLIKEIIHAGLHRSLTWGSPSALDANIQRCMTASSPPPLPLAAANAYRRLPRYEKDNRRTVLELLLAQLHRRRGVEVPGALVAKYGDSPVVTENLDLDRIIALASGQAYAPTRLLFASHATSGPALAAFGRAVAINRNLKRPVVSPHLQTLDMDVGGAPVVLTVEAPRDAPIIWLWRPSRDKDHRLFVVTTAAAAAAGATLDVPAADGLEGSYLAVAGTDEDGYLVFRWEVRMFKMCARTQKRYQEVANTSQAATWIWKGRRVCGWHAPSAEPYSYGLPRYVGDQRPMIGDMLREDSGLPEVLASVQQWVIPGSTQTETWARLAVLLTRRLLAKDGRPEGCGAAPRVPAIMDLQQLLAAVKKVSGAVTLTVTDARVISDYQTSAAHMLNAARVTIARANASEEEESEDKFRWDDAQEDYLEMVNAYTNARMDIEATAKSSTAGASLFRELFRDTVTRLKELE